ncbi:hypothetical protein ACLKMH_04955 [Psychromonas sp. KJ10-10]|uniref:hypothetical protein n=1 Tax=Psychromonas sp. KJ10-10 TaxID=3391823 RepID=UPI0039B4E0D2
MLGIKNRSESWRMSKLFIDNGGIKLANKLANRILGNAGYCSDSLIEYELFWTGFRDFCNEAKHKRTDKAFIDEVVSIYNENFEKLDEEIEKYNKSGKTKLRINEGKYKENYQINETSKGVFINNLFSTEIDLVIKAGKYILIGEFKDTQSFNAKSDYVLVHQLVRQYVMSRVLMDLIGKNDYIIIPFVVTERNVNNNSQIQLMQDLKWLIPENILSWSDVKNG